MTQQSAAAIQTWIVEYVAESLALDVAEVDVTGSFDRLGLDSVTAVGMTGALEEWLDRRIDPAIIYQFPTIATMATALADGASAS